MKKTKARKLTSESGSAAKSEDFLIAGIGASAGGIQALKEFFENVSVDSGVAYVVILHLSPDHESRLAEVLQTTAQIPVRQVKERVKVEANHVYVVPPNQHLEMLDGHIGVERNASVEERRAPVDIFLRTLAEARRARAIAVILSGTGADGSVGLKRVKECGGVVFVQNPREAEFSEMPRNSIATDLADAVLNASEIPAKIIAYKDNLGAFEIHKIPESRPEGDQAALREIFAILRVRTGHDFTNYKHPTVLRRIERRINVRELQNLADYAVFIRGNPNEATALLKDLLISVTNFFRDKEAFQFLETEVVPRILQDKSAEDEIRVWVAGCATGEEAYSLAMLFAERIENSPVAPKIQIFATDIDEDAIAHAREGFYTLVDAADVSPDRLRRFFARDGAGFRVRRELREMILFAKHNVLKDAPFSHLDLVTCRNLLIYFNDTAQQRAMETFHFVLNPRSFLFLGTSESIDGAGDLYAPVNKELRIYQSRQATAKIAYPVPDAPNAFHYVELKTPPPSVTAGTSREQENRSPERISFGDLHRQLLEQYAPPSVVVNENYDIVHLSPQAGRFLHIAGGEPSKNLLHLVRPELRLELRTALFQAVQRRANVVAANLKVQSNGHAETINIQVRPVLRTEDTARGFLLVIFEPSPNTDTDETAEKIIASDEPLARRLEEELERAKTQLRASIEQYEIQTEELRASNEELQAMNEALRSTAEELETSREELQSVNEELMTVNQELKIKIEELSISNNDFKNLLNSTDIGTIFLDRALRVKMFTPPAREVFNLIDADINRPLADITTKINFTDLSADVERVLETLQTVEREFETAGGKWYLMRVFPYRAVEDKISGAVVTFIDITNRVKNEHALQNLMQAREQQTRIFDTTLSTINDFVYIFDKEGRFIYSNRPLLDLLGISLNEIVGKNFLDLNYPEDLAARLQKQIQKVIDTKEIVRDETPFVNPEGKDGFYEYIFTPVFAADGVSVESVAGSTRDVTTRKQAELELRENREHLQRAMKAGEIFSWELDLETREFSFSENMEAVLGFNLPARIIQNSFESNMHPEDAEIAVEKTLHSVETGEPYEYSGRFVNPQNGEISWLHSQGGIATTADGRRVFAGVAQNITERKMAEEALRESEEKFRRFVNVTSDVVYRISADWRELRSLDGKEFIHSTDEANENWLEEYVPESDRRLVADAFEKATQTKSIYELEHLVNRLDGSIGWAFSRAIPVFDEAGEIVEWLGAASDVTERKRAEEAVIVAEKNLRVAVEAAGMGTWSWNVITDEVIWNEQHFALFGMTPKNVVKPDDFFNHVHPEDLAQVRGKLDRTLKEKVLFDVEFRAVTEDDDATHWMSGYGQVAEEDQNGRAVRLSGVMLDITTRKQAEEALRESEERFSKAFNVSPLILAISSLTNGRLIEINDTFVNVTGYSREEALGKTTVELGLWTNPTERQEQMETVRQNGKLSNVSYSFRTRSGEEVIGLLAAERIIIGGEPFALTVIHDITEQKRAERQIRETEERSRVLVEGATDFAILRVSPDNLVESWNKGAEKVFGWTEDEIVGKPCDVLFTPEDREKGEPQKEIKTAAAKGRAEDERWHVRRDGTRFYASGVMTRLLEGAEGFVKIARDQTDKIEAEKAVRDREILQKLVGAQEDERKRIARDLHDELGQKLTALRFKLENVRKICEEEAVCGKIDEVQLLAKNIDADVDFLAWELRPAALDDLGLVAALTNYVNEWSRHAGVTIGFHAANLKRARFQPEVETNLYRITQEALNNTYKHAKATRADVLLERRDGSIVLIIEDDGKGFNVKDKKNRSKGIGLVGMQERAAIVGGSLEIESASNQGTTIFVRVPALPVKKSVAETRTK